MEGNKPYKGETLKEHHDIVNSNEYYLRKAYKY